MTQETTTKDIQIIEEFDALHLNTPSETVESLRVYEREPGGAPPETVESLRVYERKPGGAQKFLVRMGDNFRWPASMHINVRSEVFWAFTADCVFEDDIEFVRNCIYFHDSLDKGLFNEHKEDWVMVYKQKVVDYGKEYTGEQLSDLDLKMPGVVYLPVDPLLREKVVNPKIPAARAVHSQRSRDGGE